MSIDQMIADVRRAADECRRHGMAITSREFAAHGDELEIIKAELAALREERDKAVERAEILAWYIEADEAYHWTRAWRVGPPYGTLESRDKAWRMARAMAELTATADAADEARKALGVTMSGKCSCTMFHDGGCPNCRSTFFSDKLKRAAPLHEDKDARIRELEHELKLTIQSSQRAVRDLAKVTEERDAAVEMAFREGFSAGYSAGANCPYGPDANLAWGDSKARKALGVDRDEK